MSRISVDGITQNFGSVRALDDVTLDVGDQEFITLLGPSGCGKTTLLRAIAGFIRPQSGTVTMNSVDITRKPAHRRSINMVFQRPTLFPHLNVEGNVAFGLKLESPRLSRQEIKLRVHEALALVRLDGYENRRAHELSGGQMQRVALARALVKRPSVLLLDEPLSALDLKIRLEMEGELRRVHRETKATFIYVTHDQREALALSDRIAVFENGRISQLGTPTEIYHQPANPFVARFVGDSNVLPIEIASRSFMLGNQRLTIDTDLDGAAWLVVRPEKVRILGAGVGIPAEVSDLAFRGTGFAYELRISGVDSVIKAESPAGGEPWPIGSSVNVEIEPADCLALVRT